jgi:hypothetical protein
VGISQANFKDLLQRILRRHEFHTVNPAVFGLHEKLMISLVWLRQAITYNFAAFLFSCHSSTISRTLQQMIQVLMEIADEEVTIPPKSQREQDAELFEGKEIVLIVDGAEQQVFSSSDKLLQNINFSGKKKKHTFTKLLAVNPLGKIQFVSDSYPGSVNDLNLIQMPENNVCKYLEEKEYVLGDAGFKGMSWNRIIAFHSAEMKGLIDKDFKRIRVVVENAIRGVRRWKICSHTFVGKHKDNIFELRQWHHHVWKVCCWLTNVYSNIRK